MGLESVSFLGSGAGGHRSGARGRESGVRGVESGV